MTELEVIPGGYEAEAAQAQAQAEAQEVKALLPPGTSGGQPTKGLVPEVTA